MRSSRPERSGAGGRSFALHTHECCAKGFLRRKNFCSCVPCNASLPCTIDISASESNSLVIYFHSSERLPDREAAALPSAPKTIRAAPIGFGAAIRKVEQVKVKIRRWQAMRGSAPWALGGAFLPRAPRRLARGYPAPLHPRPRRALLPCGTPASDRFRSDTRGLSVRPFCTRAQHAVQRETAMAGGSRSLAQRLAEIPVWSGCRTPFPLRPLLRRGRSLA